MNFDPTVTLSGILIFLSNVGIGIVYFMRMEGNLKLVTQRLSSLETTVETLVKTDVRLATIEERLTNHVKMLTTAQQDISDLRRGNGFIRGAGRASIDGRYPQEDDES